MQEDTSVVDSNEERRRAVLALLRKVVGAASAQRAAILDSCNDPAVRRQAEAFLSEMPAPSPRADHKFERGEVIAGRFQIISFIGAGGMGMVYKAKDRWENRDVAVKAILSQYSENAEYRKRFVKEIAIAKTLTHPNLCRIHDVHIHPVEPEADPNALPPGHSLVLSMHLLTGQTVAERLEEMGKLPPEETLALAEQLADALDVLHVGNIVHRDLKPGNIMMVPTSAGGRQQAIVMDFGLACQAPAELSSVDDSTVATTQQGGIFGTPLYMSPEQIKRLPATRQSDIYTFGLILYEMLTGSLPFSGPDGFGSALRRMTEAIPPPSTQGAPVGPTWDEAVLRCLHIDPSQRFRTAGDVIRAIRQRRERPRRLRRRRVILVILALASLLSIVAILFVPTLRVRLEFLLGSAPPDAAAFAAYARGKELFNNRRVDSLSDLQKTIDAYDEAIRRAPNLAEAIARRSYAYLWMAKLEPNKAASWKELARFEIQSAERLDPRTFDVRLMKASILTDEASRPEMFREAENELHAALRIKPNSDEAYKKLSSLYLAKNEPAKALEAAQMAVKQNAFSFDNYIAIGVAANRACVLDQAASAYEHVTNMVPDRTEGWNGLGVTLFRLGDFEGSVASFERVIEKGSAGARIYSNIGTAYFYLHDYARAERMIRRACDLKPDNQIYAGNLGDVHRVAGNAKQAARDYERAISLANTALSQDQNNADVLSSLAMYYARSGKRNEARETLRRLDVVAGGRADLAYNTAIVYALLGESDVASRKVEQAIGACRASSNMAAQEPDFARLKGNPFFEKAVNSRRTAR